MYPPTRLQVSVLSFELILSLQICCHAVFIFAHGGFRGIFCMGDYVVVLLDDVGESRCTRSLTHLPTFVAQIIILFLLPVLLGLITLHAGMFMKSGLWSCDLK